MGVVLQFASAFPVSLPDQFAGLDTRLVIVIDIALALALAFIVLFVARWIRAARHLRHATREGRQGSRVPVAPLPLTSFRRDGATADPLNVRVVGTEAQLGAAFANAGWYRADEITFITSMRIAFDAILARKYSTAPVSNLFLFGRRQDIAFEQPGRNVRERDHVRFWKTIPAEKNQRPLWIGGATKDIKVALSPRTHMPTHLIEPDVDVERDFLVDDLSETGWVVHVGHAPGFGHPVREDNGDGGYYKTDGQVVVLELANVFAPPLAAQVRGSLAARIVKRIIAPLIRRRLPEAGLARAQMVRAERAASSGQRRKPDEA